MELAFVLLMVLVGVGLILYAGMRRQAPGRKSSSDDAGMVPVSPVGQRESQATESDSDTGGDAGGGSDGGGGGGGD